MLNKGFVVGLRALNVAKGEVQGHELADHRELCKRWLRLVLRARPRVFANSRGRHRVIQLERLELVCDGRLVVVCVP